MIGIVISERIVQIETTILAYRPFPLNFSASMVVAAAAGVEAEIRTTLIAIISVQSPVL